jgi:hypothetical protein
MTCIGDFIFHYLPAIYQSVIIPKSCGINGHSFQEVLYSCCVLRVMQSPRLCHCSLLSIHYQLLQELISRLPPLTAVPTALCGEPVTEADESCIVIVDGSLIACQDQMSSCSDIDKHKVLTNWELS